MILLRTTVSCKTCIGVYTYTHITKKTSKITQETKDAAQIDHCYSCVCLLHCKMINFYLWNQSKWLLNKETQYIKGRRHHTTKSLNSPCCCEPRGRVGCSRVYPVVTKIHSTFIQIGGRRIPKHGMAFRPAGARMLSQEGILTTGGFVRKDTFLEDLT